MAHIFLSPFLCMKVQQKVERRSRLLTFIVITCYLQSRKTKNKNQSELKTAILNYLGLKHLKTIPPAFGLVGYSKHLMPRKSLGSNCSNQDMTTRQLRWRPSPTSKAHRKYEPSKSAKSPSSNRSNLTHTHTQLHFHIYTHTHEHTHKHTIFTSDHQIFLTQILIFFSSKKLGRFCLKTDGIKLTFYFYFAKLILDIFISYPDGAHFI